MSLSPHHTKLSIAWWRKVIFTITCLTMVSLLYKHYQENDNGLLNIDFLQYWSSAKIILEGQNPYDEALLTSVELSVWRASTDEFAPIIMWNPPIIVPLILPFGLLSFQGATFAWVLTLTASIVLSIFLLQKVIVVNLSKIVTIISIVTFYPIISCYSFGQISPLLLLGLSLFLWLSSRSKYSIAGLSLSLTLLKPHLLFLPYLWILTQRNWLKITTSMALGTIILAIGSVMASPDIISNYLVRISAPPTYWQTPTIGSWLQASFLESGRWVRYLPTVLGMLTFSFFVLKRISSLKDGNFIFVLIPLSLLTSPYGWTFDQILLLPTLLWLVSDHAENSESNRGEVVKNTTLIPILVIMTNLLAWMPIWTAQHHYVWYPFIFLILSYAKFRKEKIPSIPSP